MAITKISRSLLDTGVSDSSDATAITIDSSERVGIGTTSPGRKVVIAHDVGTSLSLANSGSSVYLQIAANGHDNDNSNYIGADSSKNFTFWVSNTERMRIDNSGRVGIGSAAPTGQRLTIGGHSTNDSMTEANAWFVAEATGGDGIAMGSIASAPYSTWIQSGFLNTLGTSNHYPLSLNPHGGKVGIGTTSPQSGLHIAEGGSGSDGGSVLTLSQTGFGSIVNNDDLGSVHFGGVTGGGVGIHNAAKIMVEGDGTWASNDYPTRITFHTTTDGAASSTERMRIHNDGTVTVATIPSFAANLSSAQTVTTTDTVIAFNSETYDVGGNHSNGVFTAPVAGLYAFGAHFLIYPWTAGYLNIKWFRNTDVYHTLVQYGYSGGSHTGLSPSALIQMSANDTVSLKISGGGLNSGVTVYGNQAYWWGYLVG